MPKFFCIDENGRKDPTGWFVPVGGRGWGEFGSSGRVGVALGRPVVLMGAAKPRGRWGGLEEGRRVSLREWVRVKSLLPTPAQTHTHISQELRIMDYNLYKIICYLSMVNK